MPLISLKHGQTYSIMLFGCFILTKKMIKKDDNWTNMFHSKDKVDLVSDSIMLSLILKYNIEVD